MTVINVNDYIAGALGGSAGLIVGHPFDTTKVQLQTSHATNPYSGTIAAFKSINRQGWIHGFFRGLGFPLVSYGLVNSVFFGVYGNSLKVISQGAEKPKLYHVAAAGCVGGAAQLLVACPTDVVKVVLQSQIPRHSGTSGNLKKGQYFKGPVECVLHLYRERGLFRGVYRGFWIMGMRDLPASTSYFLIYEVMSEGMMHKGWSDKAGVFASLMSGGVAGVLSWLLIMPFDVIKSQMQADYKQVKYTSAWQCAKVTYKHGGIAVFYTGALVTSLRAFPVNAVTFVMYKQSLSFLNSSKSQHR